MANLFAAKVRGFDERFYRPPGAAFLLWLAIALAISQCTAQQLPQSQTFPAPQSQVTQPPVKTVTDYTVTQVGPHSRLWQNSSGQTVTEIATGMNFWNGQQWTPSDASFHVSADGTGFVADKIQDSTHLAANLNSLGAVTVTTPDGVTLSSTPIAIGLYDAASGQSVIVATLTNSVGALADPQEVVYNNALVGAGFSASVVYSLPDAGSFNQDVVFVAFDPNFDPTTWGFAATSTNTLQLQIFTEFYDAPQPQMAIRPLYIEQDPAKRASMVSPDLIDYSLDFGDYVFGPGRAYTADTNETSAPGVTVAKEFVTSNGRTFLVESVPYAWIEGALRALPPVESRASFLKRPPAAKKIRIAAASLPSLRESRKASLDKIVPAKTSALAAIKPHGVVFDYVVTLSSLTVPALYSSDTTYYVFGNCPS